MTTPTPTVPPELDAELGRYGGAAATYSTKLANGLRPFLTGSELKPLHVKAMRRDYQVSACLTVNALPVASADWTIECSDDGIREDITTRYGRVAAALHRTATRALHAGFSPNVLVWTIDPELGGYSIGKVRDLEPGTCEPVVDDSGSYAGFRQRQDGGAWSDVFDPALTLWLVEGQEEGNLAGRSLLAGALEPWQDKLRTRLFHTRYLERFGEPVVKVRTPDGTTVLNRAEIEAALAHNAANPTDPVVVPASISGSMSAEGLAIGENLRNHSVVSLPSVPMIGPDGKTLGFAWDVDFLEAAGGHGADFREALTAQDTAIARALFIPDLLFANSDTGAYALGREHRSIFDASVEGRLADYAAQITEHVLDRLVTYNYGPSAPRCRLVFSGVTDTDRAELWELVSTLVAGGRLPVDVEAIGTRLGIPLLDTNDAEPVPVEPVTPAAPVEDDLARPREVVTLASAASVAGLPSWQIPQSYDPPPYRRALTSRERRVPFGKIESDLNRLEADAIAALVELLDVSRERVLRQVGGILSKPSIAAQIAGLETLDLGLPPGREATVLDDLIRASWGVGLDSVRSELGALGELVPDKLGPEARALARTYAITSAGRHLEALRSDVILKVGNALSSGTSRAGVLAIVADTYAQQAESEGKPVRLTTRHQSAQALNLGRRDAIERSGIPLRGAQFSALLDRRTCDLCERLDELVIDVTHPDLRRFTPPVHIHCRCVWVWITRDEEDFTPTWETPPSSLTDRFGGLVV